MVEFFELAVDGSELKSYPRLPLSPLPCELICSVQPSEAHTSLVSVNESVGCNNHCLGCCDTSATFIQYIVTLPKYDHGALSIRRP